MRRLSASRGTSAVAASALVLLVAGGGFAIARGGGTIRACVQKGSGALYIKSKCQKKDRRITWNQVGPKGPAGPAGPTGAPGAPGATGPAGPFPTGDAPSGVTIRGNYAAGGPASGPNQYFWDQISFGFQFVSAPAGHFVASGAAPPAQCPGSATNPQASPGNLCVYEGVRTGSFTGAVFDPATGGVGSSNRWGAGVFVTASASGNVSSYGTWAATTP